LAIPPQDVETIQDSSGRPPEGDGAVTESVQLTSGSASDGFLHQHESLVQEHLTRLNAGEGTRLATGGSQLANAERSPHDNETGLTETRCDRHGVVSVMNHSPRRIDYRLNDPASNDPSTVVDVVGFYAENPNGAPVRDGVWTAWNHHRQVCVVAVYRLGQLTECRVYAGGVEQRSLSLDDDLSRDSGNIAHSHIMASLDTASDAAIDLFRTNQRTQIAARQKEKRQQEKISQQQAQEARRSDAVDRRLRAIAYQEAARASTAHGPRERFPCVPSRQSFFYTPVILTGRGNTYEPGHDGGAGSGIDSDTIRRP